MQKNLTFLVLSILISSLPVVKVMAIAPAVESATPSANQITDSLKERLKVTIAGNPAPVESSTYRAFVGVIRDVIQKTIILETKDGKKQVVVGDDTTILRSPGNQTIKIENVRIDDYLIAMGTLKDEDVLSGKRLITSTSPISDNQKITGYGQITEIKGNYLTLTSMGVDQIVEITTKTTIKSKDKSDLKVADLPLNSRVIFTAEKEDDNTVATVLMLVK